MNPTKPLCSISFDLDNLWSYMKTYGTAGWEEFPSYFDILIPEAITFFERLNLKITFFVVGQDAALQRHQALLKSLSDMGHEIGNHSFSHEPWLPLVSREQVLAEIMKTEENIVRITGDKPVGFRGPGFSWSRDLLEVLHDSGYLYDATVLPTYLGPLLTAYYYRNPELSDNERERRRNILAFREGRRPVHPYHWRIDNGHRLLEMPVTTIPWIKTPFHMSYLLFLARYSVLLMLAYLHFGLLMCRLDRVEPSFILHPTDLLGGDQVQAMKYFPGMSLTSARKRDLLFRVLQKLSKHYSLTDMRCHAESFLQRGGLPEVHP